MCLSHHRQKIRFSINFAKNTVHLPIRCIHVKENTLKARARKHAHEIKLRTKLRNKLHVP